MEIKNGKEEKQEKGLPNKKERERQRNMKQEAGRKS